MHYLSEEMIEKNFKVFYANKFPHPFLNIIMIIEEK